MSMYSALSTTLRYPVENGYVIVSQLWMEREKCGRETLEQCCYTSVIQAINNAIMSPLDNNQLLIAEYFINYAVQLE